MADCCEPGCTEETMCPVHAALADLRAKVEGLRDSHVCDLGMRHCHEGPAFAAVLALFDRAHAERDAASAEAAALRDEIAALQALAQDVNEAFASGRRETLDYLRSKVEGLDVGIDRGYEKPCLNRDEVLALFDEVTVVEPEWSLTVAPQRGYTYKVGDDLVHITRVAADNTWADITVVQPSGAAWRKRQALHDGLLVLYGKPAAIWDTGGQRL